MIRAIVFISSLASIHKMFLNSIFKFFAIGRDYGMVVFLRLVITVLESQDLAQDQEKNVCSYTISARLQKVSDEGWPTFVLVRTCIQQAHYIGYSQEKSKNSSIILEGIYFNICHVEQKCLCHHLLLGIHCIVK